MINLVTQRVGFILRRNRRDGKARRIKRLFPWSNAFCFFLTRETKNTTEEKNCGKIDLCKISFLIFASYYTHGKRAIQFRKKAKPIGKDLFTSNQIRFFSKRIKVVQVQGSRYSFI